MQKTHPHDMSQLMELFPVPAQPDLSLQISTPPTICSDRTTLLTTTTTTTTKATLDDHEVECYYCTDINLGGGIWKNRSSSASTYSTTTTTTTSNSTSSVERSQLSFPKSPILIENQKQGLVQMMMKPRPMGSSSSSSPDHDQFYLQFSGRPYMAMAVESKKTTAGSSSRFPIKRGTNRAPRMRWTTTLHSRFLHALHLLGGHHRATPKSLLELMDVKDLTLAHVKSHLQMYRTLKTNDRSTTVSSGEASNETTQMMMFNHNQSIGSDIVNPPLLWSINPSYSRVHGKEHSRRDMKSFSLEEK